MKLVHLIERPGHGGRLGRHVEHDPRSKAYGLALAPCPLVSRTWKRYGDPFDQGEVGSCTGNAGGGILMTEGFYVSTRRPIVEADCVDLYAAASRIDSIPGYFPKEDTGSSGLAVCKVMKRAGIIAGYRHAFGLAATLAALCRGPLMFGLNWYEGFDKPRGDRAELVVGGGSRGGHEVELTMIDVPNRRVGGPNSWGLKWGNRGYFTISFDTLEQLLHEDGDIIAPAPIITASAGAHRARGFLPCPTSNSRRPYETHV